MPDSTSGNTLPSEVVEAIRAQCRNFESAWQAGRLPILDNYLDDFEGDDRAFLIRELSAIEQRYQPSNFAAVTTETTVVLNELFPPATPESDTQAEMTLPASALANPSNFSVATGASVGSKSVPTQNLGSEVTVAHANETVAPTGRLLIRCPHCCNGVELLAETPFEDITCHDCGSTFNLVDREKLTTAAAPRSVGRFHLEKKLGSGGFGSVWLARDGDLDRVVAVKIPRKGQLSLLEIEQFYREARAAAQLRHPNIVPVHEVGRDGDTVFIVSDYIEGKSLSEWMTERQLNSRDVAQLAITVAEALHHAHQQGIIHRDLKPSNVMIDAAGQPHIMDFGLARREAGEVTMTVDGQILGTPTYMSPEQAGGQSHWADRRTDLYSFGVMLFKMLTDELPYRGSIQRQIQQRLTEDAPDPRTLNRFIPRDLSTIVLKCLERDPNKRYPTAAAVADELRRFLSHEPIKARPISKPARAARWAKRKPAAATALALAAVLAIGGPLLAWRIEIQRRDLAALNVERANVISRLAKETKRDGAKIAELQGQLDIWEGRANPWEIWPPTQASTPRRMVLEKFMTEQFDKIAASLVSGKYDTDQLIAGHMGLAVIAEELKKDDVAQRHLLEVRSLVEDPSTGKMQGNHFRDVYAQCLEKLARIAVEQDQPNAETLLEEASIAAERLAASQPDFAGYKVDQLESEVNRSVLAGFNSAQSHLKKAAELSDSLRQEWPSEPLEVYKFATYLTGEPAAVLIEEKQ